MVATKEPISSSEELPIDAENVDIPKEKAGTRSDQRDMWRMGKAQEMRRNFRFVSIFGFTMLVMCSWETMLGTSIIGLINGGTAGLIVSILTPTHGTCTLTPAVALPRLLDWLPVCQHFHGRNGINGAYIGRTVSLGL